MMLVEETTVPQAALPVTEFKAHLRLGSGFAEGQVQDAVLESFLRAAMTAIEARTGKALIERDFSYSLGAWRDAGGQGLPVAPVSAITELTLEDATGDVQLIDPAAYRLAQDMQRPRLMPMGTLLPTLPTNGAAIVRFTAGFGPAWADLPADLAQAVMLLAAHYYEYRDETALGAGCMPFGVTSLIERYRTVRLLGGGAGGAR